MASALPALVEALHTALEARGTISSTPVPVFKSEPSPDDKPAEAVWFGDTQVVNGFAAHGPSYIEEGQLEVTVSVRKPGGGETQRDATRDRAVAIFDVVIAELLADPTVTGICKKALPTSWGTETVADPDDTVCRLTGIVEWTAHLT